MDIRYPKKSRRISKTRRSAITRDEYNAIVDILNQRGEAIAFIEKSLAVQFQRIAQLQAELDQVRTAWKINTHPRTRRS